MIEIRALTKSFGLRPVLRGIDLSLAGGESMALLGPNGVGKTTLLRIVSTLSKPDQGQVMVTGLNTATRGHAVRSMLGVVSHHPLLYEELTAEENLRFYARLYGVADAGILIGEVLAKVGLELRRHDQVRTFSRGLKQRLAIGRAILHQPPVMLLDEPYTGLDRDATAVLDEVLHGVAGSRRTILMATHDLAQGIALADRVAILSGGKLVYETRSADIYQNDLSEIYSGILNGNNR